MTGAPGVLKDVMNITTRINRKSFNLPYTQGNIVKSTLIRKYLQPSLLSWLYTQTWKQSDRKSLIQITTEYPWVRKQQSEPQIKRLRPKKKLNQAYKSAFPLPTVSLSVWKKNFTCHRSLSLFKTNAAVSVREYLSSSYCQSWASFSLFTTCRIIIGRALQRVISVAGVTKTPANQTHGACK